MQIKNIFIVAGDHREFMQYILKKGSTEGTFYKYVSDINSFVGQADIEGYYVGTWRQRPDIKELKEYIDTIKRKNQSPSL